ncbi:pentapeptide repeat-containing protein [Rossellomorea marisflavi]|uniref:pentapeptide repeat-containing protein n=1 Tax=Rossellomorea marisflavi TaxID=189381 RepID=UPI0035114F50
MTRNLSSDCASCFGLCCVALPYGKSADFPLDKDGGVPCKNLCSNHLCSIHDRLLDEGFKGCVTYECFGAGQHVSQGIYGGRGWQEDPKSAEEMFAVFPIVQQLHEMLSYLDQALCLKETEPFRDKLQTLFDETVELTEQTPEAILGIDVVSHRFKVNEYLKETSRVYREGTPVRKRKPDYTGVNLKGLNLRGHDFRGTLMIAANLKGADARKADFIGADLRDANLSGTDLTGTLFLTQSQVNSAKGDKDTKLPERLRRPGHWERL